MATAELGSVHLEVSGRAYTVKYSINVLADAEESSENTIIAAFSRLAQDTYRIADVRWLLWSGLRTAHPDLSLADAGELIQEAGLQRILDVVTQAFNQMMAHSGRPQRPTPPVNGAGLTSTKTRSRSGLSRSGSGRSRHAS